MHTIKKIALLPIALTVLVGCGGSEPTVITPGNTELTDQEKANQEREDKMMAEQRQ